MTDANQHNNGAAAAIVAAPAPVNQATRNEKPPSPEDDLKGAIDWLLKQPIPTNLFPSDGYIGTARIRTEFDGELLRGWSNDHTKALVARVYKIRQGAREWMKLEVQ